MFTSLVRLPFQRLSFAFPALRSRNYRLYFFGQGVSLIGSWMQLVAISWLCYRLTSSAFLLGLLGFMAHLPVMLLTPLTGVLADRWDRHRMMIWVQVWGMAQALVLAILTLGGWINIWHLILLNAGLGLINAVDAPNRHAFVVHLIDDRKDLPNAIAMNSAIFNSARLLGPSIGGLLIAALGEGLCFLLNALSFLAVIFSLRAMKIVMSSPEASPETTGVMNELKSGFLYTFNNPTFRLILIHFALVSMLGTSFGVLLPVMASDILKGGPTTLGFLTAGMGLGALFSAIHFARRKTLAGLDRVIGYASLLFGTALILLSLSRSYLLSILVMVGVGMGMVSQMICTNTYLHMSVDDDKRARVMAFYLLAYFASMPLGSLLTGTLAEGIGAPATIFVCGLASLLSTLFYFFYLRHSHKKP